MVDLQKEQLEVILVTDCGSTTTKALLFEKATNGWRHTFRGEAPTTVEEPVADVTVGVRNSFREIEELSHRKLLDESCEIPVVHRTAGDTHSGVDLYLSTSSAGGGLQMVVGGAVRQMSAESAERAALGAGAIVLDVIASDDGREDFERVERLRHLKPDIVLLCGGTDGGSRTHSLELAELIVAAAPRPRFGNTLKLPVIYAGNNEVADEVKETLSSIAQVSIVSNVRPTLEREDLAPAREAVHEFFLSHVMSHSPGYDKLLTWVDKPVLPTPAAVGLMVERLAERSKQQILCVDIGGATTDVFSVFRDRSELPRFNRTVSANLGMSYSMANVVVEAGLDNVARWLPYELAEAEISDRLRNKMIRPTTIPQVKEDLWLEQAICREALRLSLQHHASLAVGLSGMQQRRGVADIFSQKRNRYDLVNMQKLDLVIGSGGVLSHAPAREQAALMMLEGFGLEGITEITVDSVFMLPHLGVLSSYHPEAAWEIFEHDCLVRLGFAVVPVYSRTNGRSRDLAKVTFATEGGKISEWVIREGELVVIKEVALQRGILRVAPLRGDVAVSAAAGQEWVRSIECGACGLFLDGRNRPMVFPTNPTERVVSRRSAQQAFGLGPAQE